MADFTPVCLNTFIVSSLTRETIRTVDVKLSERTDVLLRASSSALKNQSVSEEPKQDLFSGSNFQNNVFIVGHRHKTF